MKNRVSVTNLNKSIHNYFEENLIKPKDNSHSSELDFDEKKKSKRRFTKVSKKVSKKNVSKALNKASKMVSIVSNKKAKKN